MRTLKDSAVGGLLASSGGRTLLNLVTRSGTLGRRTRDVRVISGFLRVCHSLCHLLHGFIALRSFCDGGGRIGTVFRGKQLVVSRHRYHLYVGITSVTGRGDSTTADNVCVMCYSYAAPVGPKGLTVMTTIPMNSVNSLVMNGGTVCCSARKVM